MKNKQIHLRNASFFALAFVILGYTVKFFPTSLAGFDSTIQTAIRGNLPSGVTQFWTSIYHFRKYSYYFSHYLACGGILLFL